MVFIYDEGVFDAPIDRIWKYVQDMESHNHSAILSSRVLDQRGNVMRVRQEVRLPTGSKEEQVVQFTMNPPFGFQEETLEGSTKGTKHAHTYVPMGDKTKVIVAGDFHTRGLDETATMNATLGFLAALFEEDNAALKQYR